MKKSKKFIHINTLILFVGVISTSLMRCIAILTDYDSKYGYFNKNTLINTTSWVVFAVCLLISAEALINIKRRNLVPDFEAPATYIPAGLCGAALLFIGRYLFGEFEKLSASVDISPLIGALACLGGVFALLAAAGFGAFVICQSRLSTPRVLFTLAISVFTLLFAAHIYFDNSLPLNAPNKITDLVAYIFASIFFLYEARISLGRERWNLYTLFGGISALLCAYSSIPSLIAFFAEGYVLSTSIYESILTFTLFIFITARLIIANELDEDKPCELVSALAAEARERDARVEAADKNFCELMAVLNESKSDTASSDEDKDQLSINDILSPVDTSDDARRETKTAEEQSVPSESGVGADGSSAKDTPISDGD